MSTEDNKALVRRFYEEIFNRGNMAVVDELCTANYLFHDPTGPVQGPEGFKQFATMYRTAFPDLHITIDDAIAEGDKVVARTTGRGTHKGELMGIPPTGKQIAVSGMTISRIVNGKAEETWANYDALGMLQQLGVVPAPGQTS